MLPEVLGVELLQGLRQHLGGELAEARGLAVRAGRAADEAQQRVGHLRRLLGERREVVPAIDRAVRVDRAGRDDLPAVALELHAGVVLQAVEHLHVCRLAEPVVAPARPGVHAGAGVQVEARVGGELGQRVAALGEVAGIYVEDHPARRQAHADVEAAALGLGQHLAAVVVAGLPRAVDRRLAAGAALGVPRVPAVQRDQRQARAEQALGVDRWLCCRRALIGQPSALARSVAISASVSASGVGFVISRTSSGSRPAGLPVGG